MIVRYSHHLRIVAVVTAVVVIMSCAEAPPVRDMQPVRTAQGFSFHAGTRTDQEGMPLLDLSGSHYEVGLQYGVLLRPEIRAVYGEFQKLLDQLTGGGFRRFFLVQSMSGEIEAMRQALPAGFEEELHGIAEGSGIRYSDFLFFTLIPEFLFDSSCTSIVVRRGSEIAHGRTFDFAQPASYIARYPVITREAVDGRVPYINMGFIGLPGVYTGLNERGIAVSVNTAAFSAHATGRVIPVGFLVKSVLESSTTLQEADSVMSRSSVSHYFITVSSRDERDASLYEDLGDTITKVPMKGEVLSVANAPISAGNRRDRTSILCQGEYNLAREHALGTLTAEVPEAPLSDYLLGVLGNHDFYGYRDFPAHQSPIQDSLKTINNYQTIQSVVVDWSVNRVIFSYRSSYAGYGPYLAYDLATGQLTRFRGQDPFVTTGSFQEDTDFLDAVFAFARRTGMTFDRGGWEQVMVLLAGHPGLNPFLRSDWAFSASLALGNFEEADRAARVIDGLYPDYYLGPLDRGLAAYGRRSWSEARDFFLVSVSRPINSPAAKLLAISYAACASKRLGDVERCSELRGQAVALLKGSWVPRDLDTVVRKYLHNDEVADSLRDAIQRGRLEQR